MKKTNVTIKLLHQVWDLTKSYWKSEEKKKAYGLLLAIVVLNLGVVFVLVLLNEWNNSFYTALQDYAVDEIFHQLWRFTILAFSYIILAVYAYYLQQTLIVNWRRWLTRRYVEEWLSAKTYYRLEMFGKDMDNPDQRISEDVSLFVTRNPQSCHWPDESHLYAPFLYCNFVEPFRTFCRFNPRKRDFHPRIYGLGCHLLCGSGNLLDS